MTSVRIVVDSSVAGELEFTLNSGFTQYDMAKEREQIDMLIDTVVLRAKAAYGIEEQE